MPQSSPLWRHWIPPAYQLWLSSRTTIYQFLAPKTELLLPIDSQFAVAATGDEPHPEQRFGQVPVSARVEEHPRCTVSELMNLTSYGYSGE
jgi:hypothetical protein